MSDKITKNELPYCDCLFFTMILLHKKNALTKLVMALNYLVLKSPTLRLQYYNATVNSDRNTNYFRLF